MCNIAGYVGEKSAAPILLEMLRKQQAFDGALSTGVATIHNGKLLYRKVIGDVDTLIRETDVLSLPGTIGIAHSRPAGDSEKYVHPFLSTNEDMALVTNGTTPLTKYVTQWDEAVQMLEDAGYTFRTEKENSDGSHPMIKNGNYVSPAEARVLLVDYYAKRGKSYTEALALAATHMYSDNISVMINQYVSDRIFVLRTTRPMNVIISEGETYMATTRFAFPDELDGQCIHLPLFHACTVSKTGIEISSDKMNIEPVDEMTPYTYSEGYKRISELLKGKENNPLYFDDLELAVGRTMRDLWPGNHTYVQHARLVYEILYQLHREGKRRRIIKPLERASGPVNREFMWID